MLLPEVAAPAFPERGARRLPVGEGAGAEGELAASTAHDGAALPVLHRLDQRVHLAGLDRLAADPGVRAAGASEVEPKALVLAGLAAGAVAPAGALAGLLFVVAVVAVAGRHAPARGGVADGAPHARTAPVGVRSPAS